MNKPSKLIFFISILLSVTSIQAQTIINGQVRTTQGLAIAGASVKLKRTTKATSTDSLGNYSIKTVLKGKCWLFCSSIGYQPDSVQCLLKGDTVRINFELKDDKNDLAGVDISSRRLGTVLKREYTLNEFDVVTTPGAVGDVAAALQTFPGASPAGNETGLFVHGGTARETQTIFDGMMVKNPFGSRLPDVANRSRFSAFLFDRTSFSTNGYDASYGESLSSVMMLETKGLPNVSATEFSLISLGLGAAHTERFKNSALVVGGNYYNFGVNNKLVPQNIRWKHDPEQYQSMIHYKLKTSASGMLKFYADYSDTQLSFHILSPLSVKPDLLVNRNKNLYTNLNFQDYIGTDWKLYAGIAYNHTNETGDVNTVPYDQLDDVWQEKLTLSKTFNANGILTFGAEQFQSKREEGYAGKSRQYTDVLSAGYANAELYLLKEVLLKAGMRAEYSTYMDKVNLAPRTSLRLRPNVKSEFSANYGIYYQKPDDSFLSQTADLNYEKAITYSLDYDFKAHSRNLRIEAYYKLYHDLVKIETSTYSGFQAYGPPVYINDFSNNGKGYARGVDLFWRDQRTITGGEYYISYSWVDTRRNYIDFPAMARPAFVPAHTLNIVGRKLIGNLRWQLSATYTYSSGRTYFNPNNPVFMADKTRDYHNLSTGVSYIPGWLKGFPVFNLTVTNILGFKQVYGYRYAYDGSRRETILPPGKRGVLLSFLMSIGDGSTFNH